MSRVAIVFTGGTISMQHDPQAGGNKPMLRGAEILARAPTLGELAQLEAVDWGLVPASHLRFAQLLELASLLDSQLERPEIDGAVLVQGTDSIEESAFAFDLLLRSDKPVAVTGAMRTPAAPDFDGPQNLSDAVRCAVDPEMRGGGVKVVMGGRVIPAASATKGHATALDAFRARDDGQPATRARLPRAPQHAIEDVHLVTAVVGMDGTMLQLLRAQHPRGVVVAATGSGNTSAELLNAARDLISDGTVVALTTRCPAGTVDPAYAFPGGGRTWLEAGAIMSRFDGPKTRVALALGLAADLSREELTQLIAP
jgi:L-asparaginase